MPYLETAQQWLTQSTLLLQARPSTTRITTKYTIKPVPDPTKPSKSKPRTPKPSSQANPSDAAPAPEPIRALLTLKTYDPVSGSTLKYSTTKAAEVSRLVQILGRLARPMARLPEVREELDGKKGEDGEEGVSAPVGETSVKTVQAGAGGGGGGKKKKKGKK